MKLFYTPGACSLATHIAFLEAKQNPQLEKVNLRDSTYSGGDFKKINPKGYIPAIQFENGDVLTEVVATLQYIADAYPSAKLLPAGNNANWEKAKANEWLIYISTEIHQKMGPLWSDKTPDSVRQQAIENLGRRLELVNRHLEKNEFMLGNEFSAVDAYLFTVASWTEFVKVDIKAWPNLAKYLGKVASRPAVQAALKAEGLI
jgi:glutathione S-transferase